MAKRKKASVKSRPAPAQPARSRTGSNKSSSTSAASAKASSTKGATTKAASTKRKTARPNSKAATTKGKRSTTSQPSTRRPNTRCPNTRRRWRALSDDALLDVRMCDLDLQIERSDLEPRIERLYEELDARGLNFQPHFWFSDEWFAPDGIPGIAIPFYLADPRLMRLERKMMLEVEGGSEDWCMKILRHEAGHALDTAYRLHRKKCYREVFGRYSDPYPEYYRPQPKSRRFVMHLEPWYAQSHPAEDFAETFAVWLKPGSRWRRQYKGWPAMKKLEFVDQLMQSIAGTKPKVVSRRKIEPLSQIKKTLRQHYEERRNRYEMDMPTPFDRDLLRLFSNDEDDDFPNGENEEGIACVNQQASAFLRRHRAEIERQVSGWTGENRYTVSLVIREIMDRCRELGLRAVGTENELLRDVTILVTVQTMNYLHSGLHRVAL